MTTHSVCWCGNNKLLEFSPMYLRCNVCETLVLQDWPEGDITQTQDQGELYSQDYYLTHLTEDYGLPTLDERARLDLSERVLFWTETLLRYKLPPANVLELGSAHGGFVAMLCQAGYDAIGLELSPWLVQFSKSLFNIPVLQGPLENQEIAPASLDVIVLMDVLEHLPDPCGTMKKALELLTSDGILLIQTPKFQEEKTFDELQETNSRFSSLFIKEHLFLYSQRAVQELFSRLGYSTITFEPAIFSHYDMFFIVSRKPISPNSSEDISQALQKTSKGRIMQGLLDLYDQNRTHFSQLQDSRVQLQDSRVQLQDVHSQLQRADIWLQDAYAELQVARQALARLRNNRLYKILRRFGVWNWIDPLLSQVKQ